MSTEYALYFQCDYCRDHVPVSRAVEAYIPQRTLDDQRVLCTIGTYCGPYCASKETTWAVAG